MTSAQPYINSSTGLVENSTWQSNITAVRFSTTALGDIDNDGDLDLALSGCLSAGASDCDNGAISKIYINNGTSLEENSSWQQNLIGAGYGSMALGDIDNDGDLDFALSGCPNGTESSCNNISSKIYINNGTSFVESNQWGNNLTGVYSGSTKLADINNDGKLDLALVGKSKSSRIAKIYINNGTSFVESNQWGGNLTGVRYGMAAFADVDNDGYLDMGLLGSDSNNNNYIGFYINNKTNLIYNSTWSSNLVKTNLGSLVFGDYNEDGKIDLIETGIGDYLYTFNNTGPTLIINQKSSGEGGDLGGGRYEGSTAFGDYNNDGSLDFVATGYEEGRSSLYYNNNSVFFIIDKGAGLGIHTDDMHQNGLAWGDIDNDRDLDLINIGTKTAGGLLTKVYISNASLTKNNTLPTPPSTFSSAYSSANNTLTLGWNNGSDNETPSTGLYYNLMIGNSTDNHTIVSGVYGGSSGGGNAGGGADGYFGNMMQRKNITLNLILAAGTYYWYVQTIDTGLAKSNWSARQNFIVSSDSTSPSISNIANSSITSSSVVISWSTDEMANSTVYYGTTIATSSSSRDASLTMSHSISLSGLSASTLYYYNVSSCDDSGNCNTSEQRNFTTSDVPVTPPANPSGGGGGGSGTTSFWTKTETINDANFSAGVEKELIAKQRLSVSVAGENHYIGIVSIDNSSGTATINISSNPIQIILRIGEERKIDVSNDSWYDIYLKLISILNNKANLTIKAIHEQVSSGVQNQSEVSGEEIPGEEEKGKKYSNWIWISIGIIVLFIVAGIFICLWKIKKRDWRKDIQKVEKRRKTIQRVSKY